MTKIEVIKKIADIDSVLSEQRYNRTMTAEQLKKLREKRDRLERRLYK